MSYHSGNINSPRLWRNIYKICQNMDSLMQPVSTAYIHRFGSHWMYATNVKTFKTENWKR